MDILAQSPGDFVSYLKANNIKSFCFVTKEGILVASHRILQPIADILCKSGNYDNHEGFFATIGDKSGVLMGACVHRGVRGPGAGGVRNWSYNSVQEYFDDGLRLSRGMTHKNALAEIHWGGAKGVMARNSGYGLSHHDSPEARKAVYQEYGRFMTSLHGCYVTAEDVGTGPEDMAQIFTQTRYTTCIPERFGGSGNPSLATARGVLKGIEAAFNFHGISLAGSKIAVQGCGHVGMPLIDLLFEAGVGYVIASDVDDHRADSIRAHYKANNFHLEIVERGDNSILFAEVDCVSPCATGGILNSTTIPKIKAKIVVGAANNQLLDDKIDCEILKSHNITYLPDFLVNRMGIVNCCDEHMGVIDDDPKLDLHLGYEWSNSIFNLSTKVMNEAKMTNTTTQAVAIKLAEERSMIPNPCYGHRSLQIINWLIANSKDYHTNLFQ